MDSGLAEINAECRRLPFVQPAGREGDDMPAEYCTYLDSPIGRLLLAGTDSVLTHLEFLRHKPAPPALAALPERAEPFREAIRQLRAYFDGRLRAFDLPLAPSGTPFQMSVWRALQEIPYGEVITYGELACRVGRPAAPRAAGAACGRNPLAVIIPCHRVVGSAGDLHGFGGGLDVKQQLLTLEGSWPIKPRKR
jgi:methylated-DNA-[protein]-cysteine S-methyltransferase